LSETRRYRKFTAQQKTEIVLASLRGPKTMAELCREHDIADSLLRKWREPFLAAGAERLQGTTERTEAGELRRQISRLERALGRETMEVEIAGELLRGWESDSASPGPASWSRTAAPPSSPASPGSAARRSTAARPGRRPGSVAGWTM
jgi:transposase